MSEVPPVAEIAAAAFNEEDSIPLRNKMSVEFEKSSSKKSISGRLSTRSGINRETLQLLPKPGSRLRMQNKLVNSLQSFDLRQMKNNNDMITEQHL